VTKTKAKQAGRRSFAADDERPMNTSVIEIIGTSAASKIFE